MIDVPIPRKKAGPPISPEEAGESSDPRRRNWPPVPDAPKNGERITGETRNVVNTHHYYKCRRGSVPNEEEVPVCGPLTDVINHADVSGPSVQYTSRLPSHAIQPPPLTPHCHLAYKARISPITHYTPSSLFPSSGTSYAKRKDVEGIKGHATERWGTCIGLYANSRSG
jgi:hypothetical protein